MSGEAIDFRCVYRPIRGPCVAKKQDVFADKNCFCLYRRLLPKRCEHPYIRWWSTDSAMEALDDCWESEFARRPRTNLSLLRRVGCVSVE
jgi:hypothetical protein